MNLDCRSRAVAEAVLLSHRRSEEGDDFWRGVRRFFAEFRDSFAKLIVIGQLLVARYRPHDLVRRRLPAGPVDGHVHALAVALHRDDDLRDEQADDPLPVRRGRARRLP